MCIANDEAGFTLIEVLVAMAIMAFGLTAVLQSIAGALDASARAADMVRGTQEAQSRLAMLAVDKPVGVGRQVGGSDDRRWEMEISAVADGMAQVTVMVTGRRSSVRLTTLRPLAGRR
ncbi:MAG: type II secretion system protein [Pseudomonadota bacterium]